VVCSSHAVVVIVENGYFAWDLILDVGVISCLHELLQVFTTEA